MQTVSATYEWPTLVDKVENVFGSTTILAHALHQYRRATACADRGDYDGYTAARGGVEALTELMAAEIRGITAEDLAATLHNRVVDTVDFENVNVRPLF